MNVIFLDVDGVLNSINNLLRICEETNQRDVFYSTYPFDERCMNNLKVLVEKTNSKIVISSFWRDSEETLNILLNKLDEYDLNKCVIGCTPVLNTYRDVEINEYLNAMNIKPKFIILDDNFISEDLNTYLVKTDPYVGLTSFDVETGVKLLLKK